MKYVFIPARNFTPVSSRTIEVIVLHDMEAPEKSTTAEAVANYFRTTKTKASTHYCVDNDSVVQCVADHDVAWAAPGANHNGLQIEQAGYARQAREQWLDLYGKSMLARSAALAAEKCRQYKIPAVWLSPQDLRAGKRGITSHANVSAAFRRSNHSDPGANFPADYYMGLVRSRLRRLVPIVQYVIKRRRFKNSGRVTEMVYVEPKGTPGGEEVK